MADYRCLICNRVNDASAERCWYCRSPLPGGHATPDDNTPGDAVTPATEPKEDFTGKEKLPDEVAEDAGVVPDWLARIRKLKAQDEAVTNSESGQASDEEEVPGWLENLHGLELDVIAEKPDEIALLEDQEPENTESALTQPSEPIFEGTISDTQGEPADKDTGEPPAGIEKTPIATIADKPVDFDGNINKPVFPIHVDDLPDWLSSETDLVDRITSEEQKSEKHAAIQDEEKLEKGTLPAWLKAMRPLDAVTPALPGEELFPAAEEQGILAGISGTLRAMDLEDRDIKPASNPHELVVTPSQQRNVELLHALLHPESAGTTPRAGADGKTGGRKFLGVSIAVIMLLVVLLPFAFRSLPAVIPVLFPKEVVDTFGFIQEIPEGKPVLVAAQYEAGLAGELAWASEPVIEHLVSHGVPVAILSTNFSGYALLEEQLLRASVNAPGYQFDEKLTNLGYLPGGTIGLISLVSDVRAALPYTTDLEPAWESSLIANVVTLSDFAGVLLLTDNPEIVRAWVEQSGRAEPPPPLLVVVSAQAAPLVQPYHDSGQIRGFVAGSSGALSYQMIRQVPGKASATFTSYQMGVLSAALLIFLGGAVSLINSAGSGTKKKGGG